MVKTVMAGGNSSKNKGSSAERELAKFLSEVFGASFVRSAGSGAFIGGKNSFRKQFLSKNQTVSVKGDIVPPDHMTKFVVESKFYGNFRFQQLLQSGPCPQLEEWINQCLMVVDEDDFWAIGFKINLIGWTIAIPARFADAFVFENYANYTGPQGQFYLTELKTFVINNKDQIEALSA